MMNKTTNFKINTELVLTPFPFGSAFCKKGTEWVCLLPNLCFQSLLTPNSRLSGFSHLAKIITRASSSFLPTPKPVPPPPQHPTRLVVGRACEADGWGIYNLGALLGESD